MANNSESLKNSNGLSSGSTGSDKFTIPPSLKPHIEKGCPFLIFCPTVGNQLRELPTYNLATGRKDQTIFVARFRYNLIPDPQQQFGSPYYLIRTRTLDVKRKFSCFIPPSLPGPVMLGEQGKAMRFTLINRCPDIDCIQGNELDCDPQLLTPKCDAEIITKSIKGIPQDVNVFHGFNNINMHTHGLHVSPGRVRSPNDHNNISDNVLLKITPLPNKNTPNLNELMKTGIFEEQEPSQGSFIIGYGNYCLAIPSDHPIGNFVYHPHTHGGVTSYLSGGLIGGILINGEDDPYARFKKTDMIFQVMFLRNTGVNKKVKVLNCKRISDDETKMEIAKNAPHFYDELLMFRVVNWNRCVKQPRPGDSIKSADKTIYITNGQVNPVVYMYGDEARVFRITQGMETENMRFTIRDNEGKTVPFYLTAVDGVYLAVPQIRSEMLLAVANTMQIIFNPRLYAPYHRVDNRTFTFMKTAYPNTGSDASFRNTLGIVEDGSYLLNDVKMATIKILPSRKEPCICKEIIVKDKCGHKKRICKICSGLRPGPIIPSFVGSPKFFKRALRVPWSGVVCPKILCPNAIYKECGKIVPVSRILSFDVPPSINKVKFNKEVGETLLVGTRELWRFKAPLGSNGQKITHSAHIHIRWYLVVAIKDPNQNDGKPFLVEPPIWMNTAAVPAGGWIDAIQPVLDFTGKYFLHCHTTIHEDLGMMVIVESVKIGDKKIVNRIDRGFWEKPPCYLGIHGGKKPRGLDACGNCSCDCKNSCTGNVDESNTSSSSSSSSQNEIIVNKSIDSSNESSSDEWDYVKPEESSY